MSKYNIEGIREDKSLAQVSKGLLTPPPQFDKTKFVGKWAKKGAGVEKSRLPQQLEAGVTADGWVVWRNPTTNKPYSVTLSDGLYFLLCRPRSLQRAVNAIYGNISRKRLIAEQTGETVNGNNAESGMLSDKILSQVQGLSDGKTESIPLKFNEIEPISERAEGRGTVTKRK
jgi:hypothetical protein